MEDFVYKKANGITALSAHLIDFEYKKHAHKEYALGVTLKGLQQYSLEGITKTSYPNDVMLFNPEQIHDGRSYQHQGLEYLMLYIDTDLMQKITLSKDEISFRHPIVNNKQLRNTIVSVWQAIFTEQDEALITDLLLDLNDKLSPKDIETIGKDNKIITKSKEIIYEQKSSLLNVEKISEILDIDQYQFIRFFKKHTGFTPYQYYLNVKVDTAKKIIEETMDIYRAVAECGFVDLSHLNRNFKQVYGVTAYGYLNQLK